jgi:DNA-binding transcriptional ArsR family regulator
MDIDEVLSVVSSLNSETRLRYLMLLQEDSLSTRELQTEYKERFEESMRRESVHRGLEDLRDAGILTRVYDEEEKHFKYEPATDSVVIDLARMIVEVR